MLAEVFWFWMAEHARFRRGDKGLAMKRLIYLQAVALSVSAVGLILCLPGSALLAVDGSRPIRAGIIGLDGHALDWTKILNNQNAVGEFADIDVVAGYRGGSPDIPKSMELLRKQEGPIRAMGVEIFDTIDDLLAKVDVVLLLSIDGRKHLEQARPIFAAGKPLFIDKPIAASLAGAMEVFRLAEQHDVPCFTSSALRFPGAQGNTRDKGEVGEIIGCDQYGPCPLEPTHHPDLTWYGIHGLESLLTIMGRGCDSVMRVQTPGTDIVVCQWKDGRVGTYRGLRQGMGGFGATVFGSKRIVAGGRFDGYEPLLIEIVKFFKSGKPPVTAEETLELFAMMEAAEISKQKGGVPVSVGSVLATARQRAHAKP